MSWQLLDNAGNPTIDITGATVTLTLTLPDGTTYTRTPTVSNPSISTGTYQWVVADTVQAGSLKAVFVVLRSGLPQTFSPLFINVLPA